jgi:hypothetical protein
VISDQDREPALERAMPADAVPGSTIPEDSDAEVLLRDGSWVWCRVIGQRKDRHGRWAVGIRWYASSAVGGREGWYLYDRAGIRRPEPLAFRASGRSRPYVTDQARDDLADKFRIVPVQAVAPVFRHDMGAVAGQ